MKLTEAVQFRQPLFESQFKDFRAKIRKEIINISDEDTGMLYETYVEMMNALGEDHSTVNQSDFEDPEFFMQTIRFVIDHPYAKRDLNDIQNSPLVFPEEEPMEAYSSGLARAMGEIEVKATRPENQEPDYEEIGGSAVYTVYHIRNYAAARKFCNAYKTSHCIGSSNPDWFPKYEKAFDGSTYAITAGDKLIYVHSGGRGFLITSSDNESEVHETGKERGMGIDGIIAELKDDVGLSLDEIESAFLEVISKDTSSVDSLYDMMDGVRERLEGRLIQAYSAFMLKMKYRENTPYAVFERNKDGIQLEIAIKNSKSFITFLDGVQEVHGLDGTANMLQRLFGINGTNIDKIVKEASYYTAGGEKRLLDYISEAFI